MHKEITGRLEHDQTLAEIYASIKSYYTLKVSKYGATPLGVDWSCTPTQELRFMHLLKICNFSEAFSLNDVGCGYGALLEYLSKRHVGARIDYLGLDLSPAMIRQARALWRNRARTQFVAGHVSPRIADYSVASGIFHVKLGSANDQWEYFIERTLSDMRSTSRHGFSVNFIEARFRADPPLESELYRSVAEPWMRFCKERLEGSVDVLTDYGLREFTLLVRL